MGRGFSIYLVSTFTKDILSMGGRMGKERSRIKMEISMKGSGAMAKSTVLALLSHAKAMKGTRVSGNTGSTAATW